MENKVSKVSFAALRKNLFTLRELKNVPVGTASHLDQLKEMLKAHLVKTSKEKYLVLKVDVEELAGPTGPIGEMETVPELILAGAGAALEGANYVGQGENSIKKGREHATAAMRETFYVTQMKGMIKGSFREETKVEIELAEGAPFSVGELVGSGRGHKIDILAIPFEVVDVIQDFNPSDPGYSGALSLVSAAKADSTKGFRRCGGNFYLKTLFVPWEAAGRGLNINTSPQDLVKEISDVFGFSAGDISFAALDRKRHHPFFEKLQQVGVRPENIFKIRHGDTAFQWSIAAGKLHLAGLTGGFLPGVIAGTVAEALGIESSFQVVSKDSLETRGEAADLSNPEHLFDFSAEERIKMLSLKLYDAEHLGTLLRIKNFPSYMLHYIESTSRKASYIQGFNSKSFKEELQGVISGTAGVRFSLPSRQFLNQAFSEHNFLNVRKTLKIEDLRPSPDFMTAIFGITDNRWMPLKGVSFPSSGEAKVEGVIVGGSQAIYQLALELRKV